MQPDDRAALLQCAAPLIRSKARQLAHRPPFTAQDRADIEQDILVHFLRRAARFDPAKTTPKRFIAMAVRQAVANILRHARAESRTATVSSLNVCVSIEDAPCELSQVISYRDHRTRLGTQARDETEQAQLAIDVAGLLALLPAAQRDAATRLLSQPVADAARAEGVPRTTFVARLRRLRGVFEQAGLGHYLETPSSSQRAAG